MVTNKHISKIIIAVMTVAVVLCFLAILFSEQLKEAFGGTGVSMEYESKLFNTDEIITVDIQIDDEDWNEMLENALSEEYYVCNVVINGKRINNVAVRPKGNTSLSSIAMDPDTDRFSLKLEFDHYIEGQTCYGLDELLLNNNYADATNMKEAVIFDMFQYLGADASLYNYAKVSVNGEYTGIYLALEGVGDSFMLRNFGTQDGELYKPDSMDMGGDDKSSKSSKPGGDFSFDPENMPEEGDSDFNPENMSGEGDSDFNPGNMSDMGGSSKDGGANLNYSDDNTDSYSTIWAGEVTKTGDADHRKVVTALKNISEGTDLETYLDVDNVLKYMAVHTFAVNMDSLSGTMAHNYYLYEYDGRLNIFPWDYNLSLGGMSMGNDSDATEVVNDAIDTPFSGTRFFDTLLADEEYRERYHEYLRQLVDEYVNGGRFDEVYNRIRTQIDSLVETDPTAFYSYDEYLTASGLLYETIELRAASIEGQLDGTIPSTDEGQREDSSALIDASHIDLGAMGKLGMGGSAPSPGDNNETDPRGENDPIKREPPDFGDRSNRADDRNNPSFQGASAQNSGQAMIKNGIIYVSCLAVMLVMMLIMKRIKRRR
ncbi:MAG: CotH kinase family protein [Lachnospiraceae bacterium]